MATEFADGTLAVSEEYAARIVDSVLTNTPRVVYGNVPNTGLITNLPDGCCVEVPCLVDQNGVQPTFVGDLPAAGAPGSTSPPWATSSASSRPTGSGPRTSSTPPSPSTG